MNESVQKAIDNFINSPVGSIVVGVIGVLIIALVIFSKTSLGKKLFNKAQSDIYAINEIARLSNEKVRNVEILATDKINALASEYERKSAILVSYHNFFMNEIYEIIALIPNAKVQNELDKAIKNIELKEKEIAKQFPTYDEFIELKEKARDIQEQVQEKVEEVKETYEQVLEQLKQEYEQRFKELEDKLNEREEEVNS